MALGYTFGGFEFIEGLPEPPLPVDTPFVSLPYPEFTGRGQGGGKPTPPPTGRSGWTTKGAWDSLRDSIFFEPTLINIGTSAAESNHRLDMWHTFVRPLNIASLVQSGTDGMVLTRLDGNGLTDPLPALGRVEYELFISLQTTSVIDAWYKWNFDEGSTRALNIIGLRAVIFPFMPQGQYVEKLEWATSILRTKKNEERASIRANPRREVEYSFILSEQEYSGFKTLALGWSPQPFALPLWMQSTSLGLVTEGTNTFNVDTAAAEYEVGGMVALWDTNAFTQVGVIQSMTDTTVTVDPPLAETRTNLYIAPVKLVETFDGAVANRTNLGDIQLNVNFYLPDEVRTWSNPFPVWRGYPILTERSLNDGSFAENHYQEFELFDFTTNSLEGVVDYDYTQMDRNLTFETYTNEDFLKFKNFLGWSKGRYREFWVPVWSEDLKLVYPISATDTEMVVEPTGLARYRSAGNLVVILKDGTHLPMQADGVYVNAEGYEVITLVSSFGRAISVEQVDLICEILLSRTDSDRIEFSFERVGKARLSFPIKTLPREEI